MIGVNVIQNKRGVIQNLMCELYFTTQESHTHWPSYILLYVVAPWQQQWLHMKQLIILKRQDTIKKEYMFIYICTVYVLIV